MGLYSQCETTQVTEFGCGAALFGYTKLYGQVPGGQAEYLRVPQAHFGPIKVPEGPPDERFLYLSDVLPTAMQAVEYARIPSAGLDRLNALLNAMDVVRRGGTVSVIGVYGGTADPLPMMTMFDKQVHLHMGQANVKHWVDDLMPLLTGDHDPLGVEDLCTHRLPLDEAPAGYEMFQKKQDGAIKVVLEP